MDDLFAALAVPPEFDSEDRPETNDFHVWKDVALHSLRTLNRQLSSDLPPTEKAKIVFAVAPFLASDQWSSTSHRDWASGMQDIPLQTLLDTQGSDSKVPRSNQQYGRWIATHGPYQTSIYGLTASYDKFGIWKGSVKTCWRSSCWLPHVRNPTLEKQPGNLQCPCIRNSMHSFI
jgi:hypothetical protein